MTQLTAPRPFFEGFFAAEWDAYVAYHTEADLELARKASDPYRQLILRGVKPTYRRSEFVKMHLLARNMLEAAPRRLWALTEHEGGTVAIAYTGDITPEAFRLRLMLRFIARVRGGVPLVVAVQGRCAECLAADGGCTACGHRQWRDPGTAGMPLVIPAPTKLVVVETPGDAEGSALWKRLLLDRGAGWLHWPEPET